MSALSTNINPAGSRRFWATVLCFALANIGAWFLWHRAYGPGRRDLLRVERFLPGDGATVGPRSELAWEFNLDVGQPGAELQGDAPATVTPAVTGKWRWSDTRTLLFVPEHDLPQATRVKFRLMPRALRTAGGFSLPAAYETTVLNSPLRVTSVRQAAFEEGSRYVLELQFNDRVLPADLLEHLTAKTPDGLWVKCHAYGEPADNTLRVLTESVSATSGRGGKPSTEIQLTVSAGLAGTSGPAGLVNPYAVTLHLESALSATGISAESPAQGKSALRLQFNGAPDLESLKQVLSVEPAVPYTVGSQWNGIELRGDFAPGQRYLVKIANAPAGAAARLFPRETMLSALVPDKSPGVWFDHAEGYLGSEGNRTLLAHVMNLGELRASVYRVYDNNLVAWRNAGVGYSWRQTESFSQPMATRVLSATGGKNQLLDLHISMDDLLPASAPRDGVYRVTLAESHKGAASDDAQEDDDYRSYGRYSGWRRTATSIATLSDIGLTAKLGRDSVTVWAASLRSAEPIGNVRVRAYSDKNQLLGEAITDASGIATIGNVHPARGERAAVVLAEREPGNPATTTGLTWLDLRASTWEMADADLSGKPYFRRGHEAFVYCDRGVYRPGETVHLRAIVRAPDQQVPAPFPVRWVIRRPDLREYRRQVMILDADGAAGFDLELPADLPTGQWSASIGLPADGDSSDAASSATFGSQSFGVEEFMPDRLKVALHLGDDPSGKTKPTDPKRFAVGDKPLVASVQADYLFGQPAGGLQANLSARIDPLRFSPQGWQGWTLGDDAGLLDSGQSTARGAVLPKRHRSRPGEQPWSDGETTATVALDAQGHNDWEMDLRELLHLKEPPAPASADRYLGPWQVSVAASVQEAGGRAVTVGAQLSLDALSDYPAIREKAAGAARPAEPIEFELALVRPDGQLSTRDGSATITLFRETWNTSLVQRDGRYHYDSTRVLEPVKGVDDDHAHLAGGRGKCVVTLPASGSYVLKAKDEQTGAVISRAFYASDGSPWQDNVSRENPERLEIVLLGGAEGAVDPKAWAKITSSSKFKIGQPARALVRSPFQGRLLLTVETDQVIESRVMEMAASQVEVPIDVTEACRPNAFVTATVIRAVDPSAPWKSHRAFGATRLVVDPVEHRLDMTVAIPAEIRPRSALPIEVRIVDSQGSPVPDAAVTIAAVDEGILQLTDFATPSPLEYFTGRRALGVTSADAYSQLMPEVDKPGADSTPGGDRGGDTRHGTPVHAKRVKPVSLVTQILRTDEQGIARATLAVPEFTGKLRVMAVGYAGERFGSTDRPVLVRSPLLVQSSFPRFAAPGDQFDVPLVIFNNSPKAGEVKIAVETTGADNPITIDGAHGRRIDLDALKIDPGSQAMLSCTMRAGAFAGVAGLRITAAMGDEKYEENVEIPVRPASPAVARGGYAAVSPGDALELSVPGGLLPGTETLDLRVTPWPVLQLPAGLDELERYPYGCAEQTISTCFPLAYLPDIGKQIAPGMFEPQRVSDKLNAGIYRLLGMETADGGIAMWPGQTASWPWASIYAAHFLLEAEKSGHPVPEDFRRRLLGYARRMLNEGGDGGDLIESQAYACYVLALAGKPERAVMSRLTEITRPDAIAPVPGPASTDSEYADFRPQRAAARTWLSLAWLLSGRRDLATSLLPTTPPLPRSSRQSGGNVGSTLRDRALLIRAMLEVEPENPALPALVQQLADAGANKQWRSTQDRAFAIMAIGRYLRQAKAVEPYREAVLSLAGKELANSRNGGPMGYHFDANSASTLPVADDGNRNFRIRVGGAASSKAYVTWVQSGVPLAPPPNQDQGLKVRRVYETEDGKPLDGGRIRSGRLVRVELTVEATPGTDNLVLEDLLPAGLEIENAHLKTSAAAEGQAHAAALDVAESLGYPAFNVKRLDVRDDRLVAVGSVSSSGAGHFGYLARAVAPGTFIIPPVRGECMYDEGVNSISGGGGKLVVEPADNSSMVKR